MKSPKYMQRVEFWDDERAIGNSLIVTLHYGWSFEHSEHEGVRGFDTIKEAREGVKGACKCKCDECFKHIVKVNK